jgi:O-antigen/teichoic acid export membrane protein
MLKKLFSHTIIYGLAPQITMLVNFMLLPFITPHLSAVDFGVSGILTSYTMAVSVLGALGLRVVLVNAFYKSRNQYKWGWRQVYGFLNLWNLIYAVIIGIVAYVAVPKEAVGDRWMIVALNAVPLVVFGQTSTIGMLYYQLQQKPIQIAVRTLIFGLLMAFLDLYFITHLGMGYMGWFWSIFIATILKNASYYFPLVIKTGMKPIYNFKRRYIKQALRIALPTIPHFYAGYLMSSSDQLIMDRLGVGVPNIGKFNAANTFGKLMDGLSVAAGYAIGPLMNEKFTKKDDASAKYLIFILQIVFYSITFNLSIWLNVLFGLMLKNETLSVMYPLGIILIMAQNYRPMYFGSNAKLMFTEKTNVLWRLTLTAAIINVALTFMLIPIFGFQATAYCTYIGFLYMGYAGFYYKAYREISKEKYYPILWMTAGILLTVAAYYLVEMNVLVKIAITLISGIATLALVLRFNKKIG